MFCFLSGDAIDTADEVDNLGALTVISVSGELSFDFLWPWSLSMETGSSPGSFSPLAAFLAPDADLLECLPESVARPCLSWVHYPSIPPGICGLSLHSRLRTPSTTLSSLPLGLWRPRPYAAGLWFSTPLFGAGEPRPTFIWPPPTSGVPCLSSQFQATIPTALSLLCGVKYALSPLAEFLLPPPAGGSAARWRVIISLLPLLASFLLRRHCPL